MRLPEMIEIFTQFFWIKEVEINGRAESEYLAEVHRNLPADSPYKRWPSQLLSDIGGRVWLVRKACC